MFSHTSVMLTETVDNLHIKDEGIYIDGTLGGGGHSFEILSRGSNVKLIGIDRDFCAIQAAKKRLDVFGDRFTAVKANFKDVDNVCHDLSINKVDGIVLDLGVSSYQLDTMERGFSYKSDALLDMRMDTETEVSAYHVVNTYDEEHLHKIIKEYGEERWAKRIAKFIVESRKNKDIETTFDLVEIIKAAIPLSARKDGPHPAKRTFQAIRIEVNGELAILEQSIKDAVFRLKKGGRLAIITFHSLEDRIVKKTFQQLHKPCTCPIEFPMCVCGNVALVNIITKKPILPSSLELEHNHRSRSAKLRVVEKL